MNKKYFLIGIISFIFMVFQFLLFKELLFLRGVSLFVIAIPLALVGNSVGSAVSKIKPFKTCFNAKILIAISSAIAVSALILVRISLLKNFSNLFVHFFALIWPFIFFGIYFGRIYSEAEDLKKVFLANGFGLMLGAVLSGKVFRFAGWEGGLLFICAILFLYAVFFEKEFKKLSLSLLFIVILAYHFGLFNPGKPTSPGFSLFTPGGKIVITENTELVRTDVVKSGDSYFVFTDGDAPSKICHGCDLASLKSRIGKESLAVIPYAVRKHNKALIIGTGGGVDLADALKAGIPNIVGIELNPVTIRLMKKKFKEYSGGIYSHPGIKIINEEGRSYIQNTKDSYDLIVLKGTDTATTSSFISSTNLSAYLYTKEAMRRYWEILSDKGILFICRSGPAAHQRFNFLNMLQIYKTIEEAGLTEEIKKHLCVIEDNSKNREFLGHSILLSKSEFKEGEYIQLSSFPRQILCFPGIKNEIDPLWLENSKFFNVAATSDVKPSFYNFSYWQEAAPCLLSFLVLPALIFILLIKGIGIRKGGFFLLLGIGYIAVEISVAERMLLFLGNPAYSVQVVLSSFLLFGGLGGYYGAAIKKARISLYSLILCGVVILYIGIFSILYKYPLLDSQIGRIILSIFITGPIGFLTAIPFAIALSREKNKHILYAIDAVGTTVGSFLIIFMHNYFGFNAGFAWVAAVYLIIPFLLKGG